MRRASLLAAVVLLGLAVSLCAGTVGASTYECHTENVTTAETTLSLETCFVGPQYLNESVSVTVNATNTGEFTANQSLSLYVDSEPASTSNVTVDPGESIETTLNATVNETGFYNLSVNDNGPWDLLVTRADDDQPSDVDNDSRYEDLNGDGDLSLSDVTYFYRSVADDSIAADDRFDFNGDSRISLADVTALFVEARGN